MAVTIRFTGGTREYQHAVTASSRREYDRRMYRPPFSTTWLQEGTGNALPERVGLSVEVYWNGADALVTYGGVPVTMGGENVTYGVNQSAEDAVDALLTDAAAASSVETPYWWASVAGLTRSVVTPLHAGYRVDLEWLTSREPSTLEVGIQAVSSVLATSTKNELGVTFTAAQAITLTHLRMYAGGSGTVSLKLFNNAGTLVETVTGVTLTTDTWVESALASTHSVAATEKFTVTYNTSGVFVTINYADVADVTLSSAITSAEADVGGSLLYGITDSRFNID